MVVEKCSTLFTKHVLPDRLAKKLNVTHDSSLSSTDRKILLFMACFQKAIETYQRKQMHLTVRCRSNLRMKKLGLLFFFTHTRKKIAAHLTICCRSDARRKVRLAVIVCSPGLKVPGGRRAMTKAEKERTAALIVSRR